MEGGINLAQSAKKGEQVFYATENKGTLKGVTKKNKGKK